ncbi:MAG: hypothetical protein QG577_2570 [Thermodesulfobacteriota bacterium]|nr:hypothetical protein [Thermodesulfobacteriota bacterium]
MSRLAETDHEIFKHLEITHDIRSTFDSFPGKVYDSLSIQIKRINVSDNMSETSKFIKQLSRLP